MTFPRVSFGMIALNAQPLLEYNLRALYPFAHQIIVVEGAVQTATALAAADGHSLDGTWEMLQRFQQHHDPDDKLVLVSAADEGYADGFWPEKNEMSQAYAKRASGDWLWQVDSDEFYHPEDMQAILVMLQADPQIATVSFPYIEFWGGWDYTITGKWHIQSHPLFHRLFRWGKGYSYSEHRPPTVVDDRGLDLRSAKWIAAPQRAGKPIFLHHYSYVFPKQAQQKVGYYSQVNWTDSFKQNKDWYERSYLALKDPLFLGEKGRPILQWLQRFRGEHPLAIQELRADLDSAHLHEPQRSSEDIEQLLGSLWYGLQTTLLAMLMPLYWKVQNSWRKPGL